jgi:hypothetical protein
MSMVILKLCHLSVIFQIKALFSEFLSKTTRYLIIEVLRTKVSLIWNNYRKINFIEFTLFSKIRTTY